MLRQFLSHGVVLDLRTTMRISIPYRSPPLVLCIAKQYQTQRRYVSKSGTMHVTQLPKRWNQALTISCSATLRSRILLRLASKSPSPSLDALRYSTVELSGWNKNSTSSTKPRSLDWNSAYTALKKVSRERFHRKSESQRRRRIALQMQLII